MEQTTEGYVYGDERDVDQSEQQPTCPPSHAPEPSDPAFNAGYDFVTSMRPYTADARDVTWHGWAIREGFWAGVQFGRQQQSAKGADETFIQVCEAASKLAKDTSREWSLAGTAEYAEVNFNEPGEYGTVAQIVAGTLTQLRDKIVT